MKPAQKQISHRFTSSRLAVLGVMTAAILQACAPAPGRNLSPEEKVADLYWLYSKFGENYAPLEYKEKLHHFKYSELKKSYVEAAEKTTSNAEFYHLMHQFVAEFKDAHTGGQLSDAGLPGRTEVAYLGFSGVRIGDALLVTELFPSIQQGAFPIRVGDMITRLNGKPLPQVVQELTKYRDLGQKEANLTGLMDAIFSRVSLSMPIPKEDSAKLTVVRMDLMKPTPIEMNVELPWIKKDFYDFKKDQKESAKAKVAAARSEKDKLEAAQFSELYERADQALTSNNLDLLPLSFKKFVKASKEFKVWNTFEFTDVLPSLVSKTIQKAFKQAGTPKEELRQLRNLPGNVFFVEAAKTYPTYIYPVSVVENGQSKGKKYVAYMYLNTFSPDVMFEEQVLSEVQQTLAILNEHGVTDLVIDMIDNGGGSLFLGMQLAQLLSTSKVTMPDIQFALNETWIDEFHQGSLGGSDTTRELSRRIYRDLKSSKDSGQRLSRRFNTEELIPYTLQPNSMNLPKFKIALLVNEMCASMCDIFSGIMQDNGLAVVVGSRSMGAGGNVTNHMAAPNSGYIVRQTESLIVRKDGSYIENVGVQPDYPVDVNISTRDKYSSVRDYAAQILVNGTAARPPLVPFPLLPGLGPVLSQTQH